MKKENSTNLQKYSGIAEQMLKLFSKHPETAKVLFDIIIYGNEGKGDGISTANQTAKRLSNSRKKRLRKASTEQQSRKVQ